jgi:hypothetical protein
MGTVQSWIPLTTVTSPASDVPVYAVAHCADDGPVAPVWPHVVKVHGAGAHVSATCVHVPRLHEYEQLPVNPGAQAPVSVLPLFVVVSTQLLMVCAEHVTTWQAPAAVHSSFAGHAPTCPAARSPHVPPEHFAQGPVQAVLQQKPSVEQNPVSHWAPATHFCPTTGSHAPAALHAWFAGHAPCAPSARRPHVVPPVQLAQGPAHVAAQQKSSPPEQNPLAQSLPLLAGLQA